jgi:hypothetical protein
MKKTILLFLIYNFISCVSYSQKDTLLLHFEKQLEKQLKELRTSKTDLQKQKNNSQFRELLLKVISFPDSYTYPFKSLTTLGVIDSPDKKFRIYNWNVEQEDESNKFYCFIVQEGKKKNKIIELLEKKEYSSELDKNIISEKNWYGCLYYKIVLKKQGKKSIYTLLGWKSKSNISYIKLIDVVSISGSHVKLGSPIFRNPTEILKRVSFEYAKKASMSLRFDEKYDRIIFDHLSPETPSMRGFNEYYVPDMSYDAYIFENGKWYLQEDVIGINEPYKKIRKQTIIDPETGKKIEQEVENSWIDPSDNNAPGGKNRHTPNLPQKRKK